MPFQQKQKPTRAGTSLLEVVVSTLMVGVVLVAAMKTVGSVSRVAIESGTALDGQIVAGEMIAEVLAMPYHDPELANADLNFGIESDEPSPAPNRLAFDDLDDYDGWVEGSALATRAGAARMDTAGWGRQVEVEKLSPDDPTSTLADNAVDQGVRRVTVRATSPTGEVTTLQAIRSVVGAIEQSPAADSTIVTGVLINLTTGTAAVSDATPLINHASGP